MCEKRAGVDEEGDPVLAACDQTLNHPAAFAGVAGVGFAGIGEDLVEETQAGEDMAHPARQLSVREEEGQQ
jgi:hypothetical protein